MDAARKADFLIDVIGPWYVGYYATWLEYAQRQPGRVCALTYSGFLDKPAASLKTLLRHAGVPRSGAECQTAIDLVWHSRNDHRFNEGVEGRSHQYFAVRHFERIARMLSYYPSTTKLRADLIGL
jgi:hypothetical protein